MQPNFAHEHEACILICSSIRYPRIRIEWNVFGVPRILGILYRGLYTTTSSCFRIVLLLCLTVNLGSGAGGGWSMSYYHDICGFIHRIWGIRNMSKVY
ncbi:hypothetical protein BDV37DRAFT_149203 [Aspergillus pseudonomiae]|uniref:Uncharacterized protein n=1 Tax=Aspergillus pseudonomiae TaxID=1506151 RepID=A0A5N7DA50_9EURO|nr:uncharacterized protein BDV37DRAFT_149203 [Aspergillus pseudonomiae]KAE8403109.1 hypothetical protein BDV37DRAFT_149203 [Aspergillus pseudonomiae]